MRSRIFGSGAVERGGSGTLTCDVVRHDEGILRKNSAHTILGPEWDLGFQGSFFDFSR